MIDVLAIGETMALLSSHEVGPLRHARALTLSVAGSESNVAIGLQRLGAQSAWVGRVGNDELGERIVSTLRGEGVDVSGVIRDSGAPTSLMIRERRTAGVGRIVYYRAGGPGARMQPGDLDQDRIEAAGVLHVSGITPALSASAAATIDLAISVARSANVPVSFSVNFRRNLWPPTEAVPRLLQLVALSDVVFAAEREATMLVGDMAPELQASAIADLGPAAAVVTLGSRGAAACIEKVCVSQPAVSVQAIDPVGAGDAFTAGFLSEWTRHASVAECLSTAVRCGAFAVSVTGDWEGLPRRDELPIVGAQDGEVLR